MREKTRLEKETQWVMSMTITAQGESTVNYLPVGEVPGGASPPLG